MTSLTFSEKADEPSARGRLLLCKTNRIISSSVTNAVAITYHAEIRKQQMQTVFS